MIITKILKSVFVYPDYNGYPNVVRRVHWILRFEKEGYTSDAFVETFLNTDNINSFIPANEIGNDRVLQWVYESQGGDDFVNQIKPYHEERIDYQISCANQTPYTEGFDIQP